MATEAQRARRRAQRATSARVRAHTTILPKAITAPSKQAQIDYANGVLSGRYPMPQKDTPEGKQLARMASLASWQKAPPEFEEAFKQFWYHKEGEVLNEDEEEEYYDDDDAEEEE